jgi:cytidylate kinase
MILTVGGDPGSGKDTVVQRVLLQLKEQGIDYALLSMGNLRRDAAAKKGMTIEAFNEWSVANPDEGDRFFDTQLAEYGKAHDNFIAIARLGWYSIPHSLKVFVRVDPYVGAERIFNQKLKDNSRNESSVASVEEQMARNAARVAGDRKRYNQLYGIQDFTDPKHYDVILDSTGKSIDRVTHELLEHVLKS